MDNDLLALFENSHDAVFAALKRDGRPQLSNVTYVYAGGLVQVSTTEVTAKVGNLRRDPRASMHVTSPTFGAYAVGEGIADLSAVAASEHDSVVEELIDVYRRAQGEHPDWAEYRAAMVSDRRLVIRLPLDRVYGWAGA